MSKKVVSKKPAKKPIKVAGDGKIITERDKRAAATVLSHAGWKKGKRAPCGSIIASARAANVAPQTINKWLKRPEFVEAIQEIQVETVAACLQDLRKASKQCNPKASIWLLSQIDADRFDVTTKHIKLKHKLDMEKQALANSGLEKAAELAPRIQIIPSDPAHVEAFADKYDLILSTISDNNNN